MKYNPTGVGEIELDTIVLDLNGTIAIHGQLVEGLEGRIIKLRELGFNLLLLSGDQRGNASVQAQKLGIEFKLATTSDEKENATKDLNKETTVAIGNARIDIGTFKNAKVRIATLQAEGIHTGILEYVDVIVPSINDALDMLINENVFNATFRK